MNLPSSTEVAGELVQEVDEADGTVTLVWGAARTVVCAGLPFVEASRLANAMRDDIRRILRGYERALLASEREVARLQGRIEALTVLGKVAS